MEEIEITTAQSNENVIDSEKYSLIEHITKGSNKKYVRFVLAALGSVPWVGGVLGAIAALSSEKDQDKINELQRLWLQEHKQKIEELGLTIEEILVRLDSFDDAVRARIESPEYLALVRNVFRSWDQSDTQEKRQMFKKLLINAGAITLCPDDLIRLFINWIDTYHEAHFAVIKEVYQNPNSTRGQIWDQIHSEPVREDSAEADLFKLLMSDLSQGHVICQIKERDQYTGRTIVNSKVRSTPQRGARYGTSAFDDTKQYEMTALGKQFVHYVFEDVVSQIGGEDESNLG